jgi:hypothetical protein
MLLNKIPVLDLGYVALLDASNNTKKLRDIGLEFYGGDYPASLEKIGTLTLAFKCPIFIQLALSKHQLIIVTANQSGLEAYKPRINEIGCKDLQLSRDIAEDISRTTDALLINPKAYRSDGANTFISQVITPISIYTTLIVHGSYKEWCDFAYSKSITPISEYCEAVKQIIEAEWKP